MPNVQLYSIPPQYFLLLCLQVHGRLVQHCTFHYSFHVELIMYLFLCLHRMLYTCAQRVVMVGDLL